MQIIFRLISHEPEKRKPAGRRKGKRKTSGIHAANHRPSSPGKKQAAIRRKNRHHTTYHKSVGE